MWPFRRDRKARRSLPVVVRARYDAAQTTAENARHWAMADSLSADSAGSADVRRKLRERSRYEVANNSYAKGIILTIANDCVGTGPRLQLLSGDGEINRRVETAFARWAKATDLAEKLRAMRMAMDDLAKFVDELVGLVRGQRAAHRAVPQAQPSEASKLTATKKTHGEHLLSCAS